MKNDISKDPKLIERLPAQKSRHSQSKYECQYCGTQFIARDCEVIAGKVRSCGCLRRSRRADHTQRQLDSWGANKTKWVGQRFLAHSRLAASARAAADKKLMKQLGIKDKDILFKAAQAVHNQALLPQRSAFEVMEPKPVEQVSREAAAAPPPTPSKQDLVEPTSREMIETMKELSTLLTADIKQELRKNIHYEENDEGYKIAHSIKFDKVPMPSSVAADVKRELIEKGVLTAQCLLVNGWREVLS